ncbi:MAG: S1C family serine protease [Actinobacteria bacterium]|nr:S1C family serine protease [Actinomycetota bacterium]
MRTQVQIHRRTSGRRGRSVSLSLVLVGILTGLLVLAGCSSGATTSITSATQFDLFSPAQHVLNQVFSSVVNIAVTATVQGRTGTGIGSGVVYTSDGIILTNDHVVTLDGAVSSGQSIVVTFSDSTQTNATIVGEDAAHDVAAIKVDKTGLNPVKFATTGPMQLGEWAIVIGSPLDFRNSVTLGIVSGLDRTLQTAAGQPPLTGLVQFDTPISPGNSGGGCFDTLGQLIAMPEVYLPPGSTGAENLGFGIPGMVVKSVAQALTGR